MGQRVARTSRLSHAPTKNTVRLPISPLPLVNQKLTHIASKEQAAAVKKAVGKIVYDADSGKVRFGTDQAAWWLGS